MSKHLPSSAPPLWNSNGRECLVSWKGQTSGASQQSTSICPMGNVLDVIVAVVVFSYKVFSMVAFRIHEEGTERRSYEERIKEASLLPAFDPSKVSMTYKECLHTWKGINDAIVNR